MLDAVLSPQFGNELTQQQKLTGEVSPATHHQSDSEDFPVSSSMPESRNAQRVFKAKSGDFATEAAKIEAKSLIKEVTEESSTGTFVLSFESSKVKSQFSKTTPKQVSFCGDENFEVVTTEE